MTASFDDELAELRDQVVTLAARCASLDARYQRSYRLLVEREETIATLRQRLRDAQDELIVARHDVERLVGLCDEAGIDWQNP